MDAYAMFLQKQERELSVNLRGRAARDYARGLSDGTSEESEVSFPWTFVALSELIMPQPPAADQPAAAAAQADHSVTAPAPAPAPAVGAQICRSCRRWTAATPGVPFNHICLCVQSRQSK